MIIYLYVKTHLKTGIKYLGKTILDPHEYLGSGIDWKKLLKEHGHEHSTEIIRECHSKEELNEWGRHYSSLWDVANSSEWANRIPETGGGSCSKESAEKISAKLKGRKKPPRSKEHTEKIAAKRRGVPNPRSPEHQQSLNESIKKNWENADDRRLKTAAVGKANKGRKHSPEVLEKKRQAMLEYWKLKKSQVF